MASKKCVLNVLNYYNDWADNHGRTNLSGITAEIENDNRKGIWIEFWIDYDASISNQALKIAEFYKYSRIQK